MSKTLDNSKALPMPNPHKASPRLIGVFDYTYEGGVGHFEDNKDYVVLYELRNHGSHSNDTQAKESSNIYNKLYIYPVTKESFKSYWESDEQDPSILKIYQNSYHFNNPSTEIYPKPENKVISDKHAFMSYRENLETSIRNVIYSKYGYSPIILIREIYLKEGLLSIPDFFCRVKINEQHNYNFYTLTSDNFEEHRSGLPDSIENIGGYAFDNAQDTFNTLPTNLKSVGISAFGSCKLNINILPENVTFNKYSLSGAEIFGLTFIDVDKHFPEGAFEVGFHTDLSGEEELELRVFDWHDKVFDSCQFFAKLGIHTKLSAIPSRRFRSCYIYKIDAISLCVQRIISSAFMNCNKIRYKDTPRLRALFNEAICYSSKHGYTLNATPIPADEY